MSRPDVTFPAGLALSVAFLVAGCGGSGSGEVPPVEGRGAVSLGDLKAPPASSGGATRITMILPSGADPQRELWEEAARREAARLGVVFSTRRPAGGESLAELLRRSTQEGASALIVAAGEAEGLGQALAEAKGRGIALLTLLEPPDSEVASVPAVVRGDLSAAAEELVAAAVEDAPKVGKSASGPVLIAFVPEFPEAGRRANILLEAANAAGLEMIGEGPTALPTDEQARTEAIRQIRANHPDLAMVLAGDDASLLSALAVRNEGAESDRFAIAGFVVNPNQLEYVRANFLSAVAFADEQVLGIYGVRSALDLAGGEELPDRIVTPLPVRRAPGPPASIPSQVDPEVELPPGLPGGGEVKPVDPVR